MNRNQTEIYKMFNRVKGFARENSGRFPNKSAAPELLSTLEAGTSAMATGSVAIVSVETELRAVTRERSSTKVKLRTLLRGAARISSALNLNLYQLPRLFSEDALLDSAKALVENGEPWKKELMEHGLALADVRAAITTLETAIARHTKARLARTSVTEEWGVVYRSTMKALQRYDVLVANTLREEPGLLAAYAQARTVSHTPARHEAAATTGTAEPTISAS